MSFNRAILHDRLMIVLRDYSREAIENRQVSRRLKDLLPRRLKEIHNRHRSADRTAGAAERLALTSKSAHEARIQYETHMMLFEARRTLRHFVR